MIKLKSQQILDSIHNNFLKKNIPDIKIGDNVRIGFKIFEGNKERIQFYEGKHSTWHLIGLCRADIASNIQ